MKVFCSCGLEISEARLKALPETTTCVKCSDTKKVHGFNVVEHKTGNWVQVIKDAEVFEELINLDKSRGLVGYIGKGS